MTRTSPSRLLAPSHQLWQRSFSRRLFVTDFVVVAAAVVGSQLAWFGVQYVELQTTGLSLSIGYSAVSVVVIAVWMLVLQAFATRDPKIVGSGTLEYKRVADATIWMFGLGALAAYLLKFGLARGYFLTALPIGLGVLFLSRWLWRQWLRKRQAQGAYLSRALVVGERLKNEHVATTILRSPDSGFQLVGALTAGGSRSRELLPGLPVLGSFDDLVDAIRDAQVDTVILTGADEISPADMRTLGWNLEELEIELIVAPALTDVAGPRIHSRPVAGLPLIHVSFPSFDGVKRFSKRAFDVVGAVGLIVVSLPIQLVVALAVKSTSPGALIYRQERVGRDGKPFGMLKFRSMVANADDELETLLDAQGTSDKPLFKIMNDPRITPVGRVIRKYSLDEFPQFYNVLAGQMSLVGPRPQRAAEVALYDRAAHRRLNMKPGLSGLWQVSGRSRLSWEDAIRLDLYYVENWSITNDLIILWRTLRAIVRPDGAV